MPSLSSLSKLSRCPKLTSFSIWFLYFVNAFQSSILSSLIAYATSDFESHSLLNVIYVVGGALSAAVYMPLAKVMDVWGRAQGFAAMTLFATLGMVLMAVSHNIETFSAAYVWPVPPPLVTCIC